MQQQDQFNKASRWLVSNVTSMAAWVAISVSLGVLAPAHAQSPPAVSPSAAKPSLSVQLLTVSAQNLDDTLQVNGSIAPWQEMSVGSEASGLRVTEVLAEVGQSVKKGQVLARFDAETIQADLLAGQAALMEAQASLDNAKATADMVRSIKEPGAISQQQINETFAAEKLAQARLKSAQAQVRLREIRLKNTALTAPDDGLIVSRQISIGKISNPGEEFFKLVRKGRLEWRAELSDKDLTRVKPGQTVQIDSAQGPVQGKVRVVSPSVDTQSRVGLVYVDFPSANNSLKAGMYVKGKLTLGNQNSLIVPQTALMDRDGFSYVFKVAADTSRAQRIKVQVGARQGDKVEIKSGLKAGDKIVQSGVAFLADGDLVKVLP
ncbi:MAG: efflux RND transporter periplasmic adaptor subunit [Limnobacter sp.]|nr:efflux RND transporter periplasmic adaptor subunit [Limnobacter sp.]